MTKESITNLVADMKALGIGIAGSAVVAYGPDVNTPTEPFPVVQLDAKRWFVLDVDSAEGLGKFHQRLRTDSLPGLRAYVLTDKGVLLVYDRQKAHLADIDGDVRYERISQERGHYDMRVLSKVDGSPRVMSSVITDPCLDDAARSKGEFETIQMIRIWNHLSTEAVKLGAWAFALRASYVPPRAEKTEVFVTFGQV